MMSKALGIDVGGSSIKGAVVECGTGAPVSDQATVTTPNPATPRAVATAIMQICDNIDWHGPIGIALPSVIRDQHALSAANIDDAWIGVDVPAVLSDYLGTDDIAVLNDADAAGLAEVAFGDASIREGSVLFLTFGTGIGSALFVDGKLFPNTELGHMTVGDDEAEHQAASSLRDRDGLSYAAWASRVDVVLHEFEQLFNPTAFVVGGGVSHDDDKWVHFLTVRTPVRVASLRNRAGFIGAALAVSEGLRP